jgi:hypothetical protein
MTFYLVKQRKICYHYREKNGVDFHQILMQQKISNPLYCQGGPQALTQFYLFPLEFSINGC